MLTWLYRQLLELLMFALFLIIVADVKLVEVYFDSVAFEGLVWDLIGNMLYFVVIVVGQSLMCFDVMGSVMVVLVDFNGINGCFLSVDKWLFCVEYCGYCVVSYVMMVDGVLDLKVLVEDL